MPKKIKASQIVQNGLFPKRLVYAGTGAYIDFTTIPNNEFKAGFLHRDIGRKVGSRLVPLDSIEFDVNPQPPAGCIFHLSHVGSTVVGNMFRALPDYQVISEPLCLGDAMLSPQGAEDMDRYDKFAKLLTLFCAGGEVHGRRTIFKFMSWALLHSGRLKSILPDTPFCLLHRDPVEILVGLSQKPADFLVRKSMRRLIENGEDSKNLTRQRLDALLAGSVDYFSEGLFVDFLGEYLLSLIEAAENSGVRFLMLDKKDIPEKVIETLPEHFGIKLTDEDRHQMLEPLKFDAKRRAGTLYTDDSSLKQREATPNIRDFANQRVLPALKRLIEKNSNHSPTP